MAKTKKAPDAQAQLDTNCSVCKRPLNFQRKFGGFAFGDAFQEALMRMAYKCRQCGTPICRECAEKSRCANCGNNTFDIDMARIH